VTHLSPHSLITSLLIHDLERLEHILDTDGRDLGDHAVGIAADSGGVVGAEGGDTGVGLDRLGGLLLACRLGRSLGLARQARLLGRKQGCALGLLGCCLGLLCCCCFCFREALC